MKFNYIYGKQAEQYDYLYMPKAFMKEEPFKSMTATAKIMYALLMEKQQKSVEKGWVDEMDYVYILANEWLDEDGKVYINYSLEDIMTTLNCGKTKVVALLKELDSENGIGLIEKKNMGIARASVFYVMNFICEDEATDEKECSDSIEERIGIASVDEDLSNPCVVGANSALSTEKSLKMRQINSRINYFETNLNLTLLETGIILCL